MEVACHEVPKEGVLSAEWQMLGHLANRHDLLYSNLGLPGQTQVPVDLVLARISQLPEEYWTLIREHRWGVRYWDARYVLLDRHFRPERNEAFIRDQQNPKIAFAYTRYRHGKNVMERGYGPIRYWAGGAKGKLRPISLGGELVLAPGDYEYAVTYRSGTPGSSPVGTLILNDTRLARHVLTVPMDDPGSSNWHTQILKYHLAEETKLELQVMGGDPPLWLKEAVVKQVPAGAE